MQAIHASRAAALSTTLLLLLPAFGQSPIDDAKDKMVACIVRNMAGKLYANARETSYNFCRPERTAWMDACLKIESPEGFDSVLYRKCEFKQRDIEDEVDRSRQRPPERVEQPTAVQLAIQDLYAGRPLPGLPDLDKVVYLSKSALVCSSPGALANPDTAATQFVGACQQNSARTRVQILQPRTQQQYIECHIFGYVQISWRSARISDATAYSGWVRISALSN